MSLFWCWAVWWLVVDALSNNHNHQHRYLFAMSGLDFEKAASTLLDNITTNESLERRQAYVEGVIANTKLWKEARLKAQLEEEGCDEVSWLMGTPSSVDCEFCVRAHRNLISESCCFEALSIHLSIHQRISQRHSSNTTTALLSMTPFVI